MEKNKKNIERNKEIQRKAHLCSGFIYFQTQKWEKYDFRNVELGIHTRYLHSLWYFLSRISHCLPLFQNDYNLFKTTDKVQKEHVAGFKLWHNKVQVFNATSHFVNIIEITQYLFQRAWSWDRYLQPFQIGKLSSKRYNHWISLECEKWKSFQCPAENKMPYCKTISCIFHLKNSQRIKPSCYLLLCICCKYK